MGVSFKVSKTGTRFRPKPPPQTEAAASAEGRGYDDDELSVTSRKTNLVLNKKGFLYRKLPAEVTDGDQGDSRVPGCEVSFALSLFTDGYSIAKPVDNEPHQASVDVPKFLHPYNRASESLFSAIESGRLPGDFIDDIPCKYSDGTLVCEVRDYRNRSSEAGISAPSADLPPVINIVRLKMSLENVVKDMPSISDNEWTYGDLMEVESRILKALQPQLCLDPCPKLDRLCNNPASSKLKLDLSSMRRKRLRQISDVMVTVKNKFVGKKVCIDKMPESSRMGDSVTIIQQPRTDNLHVQNNGLSNMLVRRTNSFGSDSSLPASPLASHSSDYQTRLGNARMMQEHRSGPGASPRGQDLMIPYSSNINSGAAFIPGKRDFQDGQPSPLSSLNKRSRLTPTGADGNQLQHVGPQMDGFYGPESHCKTALLQQQSMARNTQHGNTAMQKYPHTMFEAGLNQEAGSMPFTMGQQGIRGNLKEGPVETDRSDKPDIGRTKNEMLMMGSEMNNMEFQQARLQQRLPQQFMRSGFPQASWNNISQQLDNNSRKEEHFHNGKVVQSPRVSSGGLPQSPLSSKSGEFSSGSIGPQFGNVTSALVASQKAKSAVTSGLPGPTSLISSVNDAMQRQQQAQIAAKRRSSSVPMTPAISGVGSPASFSNISGPINASSPPVGTSASADLSMLERFSKIDMVTVRFQLNYKKNKGDAHPMRKSNVFPTQQLLLHLSGDSSSENLKDEAYNMPLSKSLVGGSMNVCKTRILKCTQTERIVQENSFAIIPKAKTKMIMSEKPDGSVALYMGEIEDEEYCSVEDCLPTLPNTHIADLLAEQFFKLMLHEGYHVEDLVQPKLIHKNIASSSQTNVPGKSSNTASAELQQISEGVASQPSKDIAKPSKSNNMPASSPQNIQGPRMLSPGNAQALQISQGFVPGVSMPSRTQHPDPLSSLQQQQQQNQHLPMQQQHPQIQRSPLGLSANARSHLNAVGQNSNVQMGANMGNKPSPVQLQLLQQQQQQQQQQMQRKMMMGLGTVGMGNMANNMVGLGALGSVMNMGGVRGVGGTGISAAMGSIPGIGNAAQAPMNLSQVSSISNAITQQLRSGALTPAQAAIMTQKLRMAQNKTNMFAGPQSTMGGMAGGRQMHAGAADLSALDPALRPNMNPMQRAAMGAMAPPKMTTGMNPYMPQQQQQQLQLQQQQLQLQQRQLQQQQQETSQLQAVVSPPQVGSPSNTGLVQQMNQQAMQQQQSNPQQMSQRTPMSPQLSSGAIHPMSAGNVDACPASPQLSTQTLGSVGSITNSPMELQNKNNSGNNS